MKFSNTPMHTATPAQVAANQANAQRSTGPRTPQGKAASALNNFRHDFNGAFTVPPGKIRISSICCSALSARNTNGAA
jgi:hypothetical protein